MRDTKYVPCTRHRISSALFCQPTPVYRPTRNFYKTLVSDDWLGIIIFQLCLILLACSASFDFTFCPLRGSAGRAEPFKLTSGDETSSNDNVCSTYRFSDWAINPLAGRRFRNWTKIGWKTLQGWKTGGRRGKTMTRRRRDEDRTIRRRRRDEKR